MVFGSNWTQLGPKFFNFPQPGHGHELGMAGNHRSRTLFTRELQDRVR